MYFPVGHGAVGAGPGQSRERSNEVCRISEEWSKFQLIYAHLPGTKYSLHFVQTLEHLPQRQHVAELPEIEWKGYMESLQQVAKQHSSIYLNTRRQNKPLITELNEKPTTVVCVCMCPCVCVCVCDQFLV